jgi:sigma-E factor negative regulatory protein RseC
MTEVGRVVSVNEEAAVVAMGVSSACEKCGMCMSSADGREVLLLARNDLGATDGDAVELEIKSGRVLIAAFALYMLPVLMTILGFIVGDYISGSAEDSFLPIGLAVLFLVASFIAVWLFDMRLRRNERREATITRILSDDEARQSGKIEVVKLGG